MPKNNAFKPWAFGNLWVSERFGLFPYEGRIFFVHVLLGGGEIVRRKKHYKSIL
jgi:hypothetical protein